MAKKIYVGNMNYSTTKEELIELFAQYGEVVDANIVMDRYTNQSKGFAFIEMESEDAAEAAIDALNNTELKGRSLRVNEAHDRKQRPRQNNRY